MAKKITTEQAKQERYRDARFNGEYDNIWQSVGKCVFCDLREKYILFEENGIVMTITLFAYVDGQFMIVPRRHVTSVKELNQLEWDTVRKFMYTAKKIIKKAHNVKGLQFIQREGQVAQSTVEHLHFQCIPFDSPDLSVWNYRKLQYTPLENLALYKKERKHILRTNKKFEDKYQHSSSLPVVCDAIIINANNDILFIERSTEHKLSPDVICLPGGHVDDFNEPLVNELIREVYEEIGYKLKLSQLSLHTSEISSVTHRKISRSLQAAYTSPDRFLWNTYVVKLGNNKPALKAGDDARELVWVPLAKIAKHPRISPHTKDVIARLKI